MRVAHIESGRRLYGGARQVLYLIGGLRRQGIDNVLICAAGSDIAAAAASDAVQAGVGSGEAAHRGLATVEGPMCGGLETVELPMCGGLETVERPVRGGLEIVELPMRGDLDVGAVRRLRRALSALRPDLVHVHSRRGAELFGGLACAGAPWPAVLTRRVDRREWGPWARLKWRPYAAVVAISRAIEAELVERAGLRRARVHLVPSGVDTTAFRPDPRAGAALRAELGLSPAALVAGVVAQLIPRKGHGVLLRALPEALRGRPDVKVVLFGAGPLERRLRAETERLGLGGAVVLAGFRANLPSLLPGLDVLLHPARAEGMGLAVLEAMACGVPVAASAAGGLVDLIDDGVDGLLVPPGDARGWTLALDRLLGDADERRRLGTAGRRRVAERFSAARMVAGNLEVYRAVLGDRPDLAGAAAAAS